MHFFPVHRTILFATVAAGLAASPLHAQFAEMFSDSALGPRDVAAAQAAGNALFENRTPGEGDLVRWRNETSGASGSAQIAQITDGGTCAVVEHRLNPGGSSEEEILKFRRCKDAGGVWQPGVAN